MDHHYAINELMAERYVLGELTDAERDAYETHFFGCRACAEEISSTAEFIDAARMVLKVEKALALIPRRASPRSLKGFLHRLVRLFRGSRKKRKG
jgi:anti-sigma factor RsiW